MYRRAGIQKSTALVHVPSASANVRTIEVEHYESMSEFELMDDIKIHSAYISCNNASFDIRIREIDRHRSKLYFDILDTKIDSLIDSVKIRKQP